MRTFEQYLKDEMHDQNIKHKIDFSIRASEDESGNLTFYIHPAGKDGDTEDFIVEGNTLKPIIDTRMDCLNEDCPKA